MASDALRLSGTLLKSSKFQILGQHNYSRIILYVLGIGCGLLGLASGIWFWKMAGQFLARFGVVETRAILAADLFARQCWCIWQIPVCQQRQGPQRQIPPRATNQDRSPLYGNNPKLNQVERRSRRENALTDRQEQGRKQPQEEYIEGCVNEAQGCGPAPIA